jgi:hypothetical protein
MGEVRLSKETVGHEKEFKFFDLHHVIDIV